MTNRDDEHDDEPPLVMEIGLPQTQSGSRQRNLADWATKLEQLAVEVKERHGPLLDEFVAAHQQRGWAERTYSLDSPDLDMANENVARIQERIRSTKWGHQDDPPSDFVLAAFAMAALSVGLGSSGQRLYREVRGHFENMRHGAWGWTPSSPSSYVMFSSLIPPRESRYAHAVAEAARQVGRNPGFVVAYVEALEGQDSSLLASLALHVPDAWIEPAVNALNDNNVDATAVKEAVIAEAVLRAGRSQLVQLPVESIMSLEGKVYRFNEGPGLPGLE